MYNSKLFKVALSIVLLLLGVSLTEAQVKGPYPPTKLSVKQEILANTSPPQVNIILSWSAQENVPIVAEGFVVEETIFRKGVRIGKQVKENVIAQTNSLDYSRKYTDYQIGDTVLFEVHSYNFKVDTNKYNYLSEKIRASIVIMKSSSEPNDYAKIVFDGVPPKFTFEKTTIKLGINSNLGSCKPVYKFSSLQNYEMFKYSFDEKNGLLTIYGEKIGMHGITVTARVTCGGKVLETSNYIYSDLNLKKDSNYSMIKWNHDAYRIFQGLMPNTPFTCNFQAITPIDNPNFKIKYEVVSTDLKNYTWYSDGTLVINGNEQEWHYIEVAALISTDAGNTWNKQLFGGAKFGFDGEEFVPMNERSTFVIHVYDSESKKYIDSPGVVTTFVLPNNGIVRGKELVQNKFENGLNASWVMMRAGTEIVVMAHARGYVEGFYLNNDESTQLIESASIIKLKANDTIELKIYLTKKPPVEMRKVSGKVSIKGNNNADIQADVIFHPYEKILGSKDRQDLDLDIKLHTTTNRDGTYEINLPMSGIFIAMASSSRLTNSMIQPQIQFYNKVTTPLEADILVVDGDIDNVDFEFDLSSKMGDKLGSFTGSIKGDKGELLQGTVVLFSTPKKDKPAKKVATFEANPDGYYQALNVPYGEYVVLTIPNNKEYFPGFMKNGSLVTLKWRDAERVTVGEVMPDVVYTSTHKKITPKNGLGGVVGRVTGSKGIVGGKSNELGSSDGLAGSIIYLLDNKGSVVDYSITEKTGNFEISQVANGQYTLLSDAVGFVQMRKEVVIDYKSNPIVETNIALNEDATLSSEVIANSEALTVSPMPVINQAQIRFTANDGAALVNILNQVGQQIDSFTQSTTEGVNVVNFDFSNYPSGAYIVTVSHNGDLLTRTFTVNK
jgi:hypothetical protein